MTFTHLKAAWNYSSASAGPNWEYFQYLLISFNAYFPAALASPSVTPHASFQAVGSWICNHDFMCFMEGKILPNCIKKKSERELRLPRCFWCQTYAPLLHDLISSDTNMRSFQPPLLPDIILLLYFHCVFVFFLSHVWQKVPAFSGKPGLHVWSLGRKTANLAFLPLRKCRGFCDNPFIFSFVETSVSVFLSRREGKSNDCSIFLIYTIETLFNCSCCRIKAGMCCQKTLFCDWNDVLHKQEAAVGILYFTCMSLRAHRERFVWTRFFSACYLRRNRRGSVFPTALTALA